MKSQNKLNGSFFFNLVGGATAFNAFFKDFNLYQLDVGGGL